MFILGRGVEQFRAMLSTCYHTQQFPNCMSPSSLCCTTTDRSSMQLPTASTVTTSTHVTCLHCAICDMRANRRFCADRHTTCRFMFAFMGNLNAYRSPGMISANLIRALATQVTIPITALRRAMHVNGYNKTRPPKRCDSVCSSRNHTFGTYAPQCATCIANATSSMRNMQIKHPNKQQDHKEYTRTLSRHNRCQIDFSTLI